MCDGLLDLSLIKIKPSLVSAGSLSQRFLSCLMEKRSYFKSFAFSRLIQFERYFRHRTVSAAASRRHVDASLDSFARKQPAQGIFNRDESAQRIAPTVFLGMVGV